MARDIRLSIKLSEEKHQELKEMAESYGVTMSALSALIIGQWLHQQREVVKPMIQQMSEVVSEVVRDTIKEESERIDRQA